MWCPDKEYMASNDKKIACVIVVMFLFGIIIGVRLVSALLQVKMEKDYCEYLTSNEI